MAINLKVRSCKGGPSAEGTWELRSSTPVEQFRERKTVCGTMRQPKATFAKHITSTYDRENIKGWVRDTYVHFAMFRVLLAATLAEHA
jgi:hypothetical protein